MSTDDLRKEWHFRAHRIDSLHDEAWAIQTVQNERMTEIWLEVQQHRARIKEIIGLGVTFDAPTGDELQERASAIYRAERDEDLDEEQAEWERRANAEIGGVS